MEKKQLKIAVVGAGPCGLCCAKHSLDYGHDVTVYEQTSEVGGTWFYTDKSGNDEFGIPIHTSMYQGLLTNAPIDLMSFLGHPFPRKGRSFVSHEEVLAFLHGYVEVFGLKSVIKFRNQVVNVRPLRGDRWEVLSNDLRNDILIRKQFDAIFLCSGHYSEPVIPEFDGLDEFFGDKMHSHDYRKPDRYQHETVFVIGGGTSGRDITLQIATKAKRVIWSNHSKYYNFTFPSNVKKADDVKRFTANSVQFIDGNEEQITCILFCTGYKYSFPFLSVDCGLRLNGKIQMEPLYKEVINVNHPTMAIVGLSVCILTYLRHDLQANLCLKYWSGEIELPTKQKMLEELRIKKEIENKDEIDSRRCSMMIDNLINYLYELSEICRMNVVPKVFHILCEDLFNLYVQYPTSFREFNYTILDDETFERKHISE
ncbi:senecionine N-oxygenase-like [Contarinia nasturtii]|uniref:senecionine N-oxygenase-like n=1 Tax=Contarinia nasturtii TaxID=265458 RepID=UPI0012D4C329|nr:senecionine N-oxygenase-like [Contarinia nasturtii]XP_031624868.1 senecionine N-oxygenase-like [Contarinia nasturtii]XP_031624869.1 senecionine N-oxygenase-like [Contarinia nasturtii]XP_031624870.1 senecionine N-oxygenase-like [Contarinia nasturtii]